MMMQVGLMFPVSCFLSTVLRTIGHSLVRCGLQKYSVWFRKQNDLGGSFGKNKMSLDGQKEDIKDIPARWNDQGVFGLHLCLAYNGDTSMETAINWMDYGSIYNNLFLR